MGPIGGEPAYDWGDYLIQPGKDPTDNLANPVHRDFTVNLARKLHVTQLGWIGEYDQSNPQAVEGAAMLQKALGYRFVLHEASFPGALTPGQAFNVSFKVRNDGSAPFYDNWPVTLFLLDPSSRKVVWQQPFDKVDIRQWMPGDKWDDASKAYQEAPQDHSEEGSFTVPDSVAKGEYVLALAVLDPMGGMLPSLRFSNQNYWNGGYFPIGRVGVGVTPATTVVDAKTYDNPGADNSLHYINPRQTPEQKAALEAADQKDPLYLFHPINWWGFGTDADGVTSSVEVHDVTQPNPGVIFHYDLSKAAKGGRAFAHSLFRLDTAKALKFSVKCNVPFQLGVILYFFDSSRNFEYNWSYNTPGQTAEFELPFDTSKLRWEGRGTPTIYFPLTKISFFVRKDSMDPPQAGTIELSNFQKISQ